MSRNTSAPSPLILETNLDEEEAMGDSHQQHPAHSGHPRGQLSRQPSQDSQAFSPNSSFRSQTYVPRHGHGHAHAHGRTRRLGFISGSFFHSHSSQRRNTLSITSEDGSSQDKLPPLNPLRTETLNEMRAAITQGNAIGLEECLHDCHELIDATDDAGMTPFLLACKISDPECVRILLENGSDVHATDKMGRGGLHWVLDVGCHCEICSNKNVKCLEMLFQYGAYPNAEDFNGEIPLHFAAKNMLPKCAQVLLDNGADIDHASKAKHVGYMMVQKIPEVMRGVLDKGVLYDEQDSSKLKLDFGWILNTAGVKVNPNSVKSLDNGTILECDDEKQAMTDSGQQQVQDEQGTMRRRRETDLLVRMLRAHRSGREALLTHPWTEAFLHLKWLSVRKWFWIIRTIYGLMLLLYSFFIFNIYIWSCPPDDEEPANATNIATMATTIAPDLEVWDTDSNFTLTLENSTLGPITITKGAWLSPLLIATSCETSIWINFMGIFVALSACAMIFNEIYEFIQDRHVYVQTYLNIGWWVLIVNISCTLPPAFGLKPRQWQYPMAAFGLFFAWGMNLTQIGRIPAVGVYVEMLGKVLRDCFIFLLTYASLMIAFTLGMCVMFPKNEYFRSVPLGFIKSLLMMIGENDYHDIFDEDNLRARKYLEYSIPAHIMYAGFIFIITIVMMNLLLGLAVSDIQELRKHSTVTRISRQISQIVLVESIFYSKFFPQRIVARFFPSFSADSHIERYFRFSPTDPDDTSLPEDLKQKFVPYLTSSPCLNKQAVLRRVAAVNKWKSARRSSLLMRSLQQKVESVTKDKDMAKEMNPRKLMLQNLSETVNEIKAQLQELTMKMNAATGTQQEPTVPRNEVHVHV